MTQREKRKNDRNGKRTNGRENEIAYVAKEARGILQGKRN